MLAVSMMLTVVYLAALVLHCTVLLHAEANMYEAGISAQHGSQCSAQNRAACSASPWSSHGSSTGIIRGALLVSTSSAHYYSSALFSTKMGF